MQKTRWLAFLCKFATGWYVRRAYVDYVVAAFVVADVVILRHKNVMWCRSAGSPDAQIVLRCKTTALDGTIGTHQKTFGKLRVCFVGFEAA